MITSYEKYVAAVEKCSELAQAEAWDFLNSLDLSNKKASRDALNKTVINPQSDVLLISNVRNRMTMFEMERSLEFAFGRESILTDDEKAEIKKVILLDERTRRIRTYEMN